MLKRLIPKVALVVLTMVLTTVFQPLSLFASLAQPGSDCQTFKETGHTVCGKFLKYWQQTGGLTQHGFPISPEINEMSQMDGKPHITQYFQRSLLELHPENAGTPYEVELGLLGSLYFKERHGGPGPVAPGPRP